jgi:acetyltransferase-like isoleucine patch superfamily enzyme
MRIARFLSRQTASVTGSIPNPPGKFALLENLRRAARALRYASWTIRSHVLLIWYRSLYAGLETGRGVHMERGVHLSVVRGGHFRIGEYTAIEGNVAIDVEGELAIGANSFVGLGTIIVAAERILIGEDCLIAAYTTIRDQDHVIEDPSTPYRKQGRVSAPITIGRNVWIGTKATILRGVTIGDNSVIGANSVVTRDVDSNCVVVGNPAKVVRRLGLGEG